MTYFAADFGPANAGLSTVGVTQLAADGSTAVARTTAGVANLGNGAYGADIALNESTTSLKWDNGTGLYAIEEVSASVLAAKILRNKMITNPSTGVITIYDDDGTTPLLTANIYEDASGAQPYRGQGAERRDRLV